MQTDLDANGDLATHSLELVHRELGTTLDDARREIESYVDAQAGKPAMQRAAKLLHLACGALKIVEVHGAALLAEEMEHTCLYLFEDVAEDSAAQATEALTRAMVQLPAYLDRLLSGGRDVALVLLPLINDLRAVRSKPLMSEGTLLLLRTGPLERPDAGRGDSSAAGAQPNAEFDRIAQQQRPIFQSALLGWIRGAQTQQNLAALIGASSTLEQAASTTHVRHLWRVLCGVFVVLHEGSLEATVALKRLVGQADRQLKRLADGGEQALRRDPPLDLINNLLYYVARARSDDERVASLREEFNLNRLVPGEEQLERAREGLAGPSVKLMRTVADAIRQDLNSVKDNLDIFVRTGMQDLRQLLPQLEMLQKIGDTLGVLGLDSARSQIQEQMSDLNALVETSADVDADVLERIAAVLLRVEDELDRELVRAVVSVDDEPPDDDEVQYGQVTQAVMSECIVNLAKVKEAVVRLVGAPEDTRPLEGVRPQLRGIAAGLLMLNKTTVVRLIERIGAVLLDGLTAPDGKADAQRIERLADAIVSVEYYMETVSAGRKDPWYMLENAARCLALLEATPATSGEPLSDTVPHSLPPSAPAATPAAAAGETAPPAATAPHSESESESEPESERELEPATESQAEPAAEPAEVGSPPQPVEAAAQGVMAALESDEITTDPELIEIFIEEAKGEIAELEKNLPRWLSEPEDHDALSATRRSFHTLKGSGRTVGAQQIGDFAWSIENMLNRVINRTLPVSGSVAGVVSDAVNVLPMLLDQLELGITPKADIEAIRERADVLASGEAPEETETEPAAAPKIDPVLAEIFIKETRGHLATVHAWLERMQISVPPFRVEEGLYRAAHTLLGSANMANYAPCVQIAEPLSAWVSHAFQARLPFDDADLALLGSAADALGEVVDELGNGRVATAPGELLRQLVQRIDAASRAPVGGTSPPSEQPPAAQPQAPGEALDAAAAAPPEVAARAEISAPPEVVEAPEAAEEPELAAPAARSVRPEAVEPPVLIEQAGPPPATAPPDTVVSPPAEQLTTTEQPPAAEQPTPGEPAPAEIAARAPSLAAEFDPEIAAIFTEEAAELLESGEAVLQELRDGGDPESGFGELLRLLHTLKGGARLAGITAMGDLSHALETVLESFAADRWNAADGALDVVQATFDQLQQMREAVDLGHPLPDASALLQRLGDGGFSPAADAQNQPPGLREEIIEATANRPLDFDFTDVDIEGIETPALDPLSSSRTVELGADQLSQLRSSVERLDEEGARMAAGVQAHQPESESPKVTPPAALAEQTQPLADEPAERAPAADGRGAAEPQRGPERADVTRVDAQLLDSLLNAAGEISIFQARLNQQVRSVDFHLGELGQTVTRLHEQLRKLEAETEAEILHRHQDDSAEHEDFDPLELDRYSTIQQLSRALSETANDVASINELLLGLTNEADTLLTQQGRVTADIQDGLMQTRMVPFQRHVTRFARVVRQTAAETGKSAELEVEGAAAELDRHVLDSMLPALEHLLRNSVVHGIETADVRRQAGKPPQGRIMLRLNREGGEVSIDVEDDGGGLNIAAITRTAVERGLLADGQTITEKQAAEMILMPGFSTAGKLTQSAGRGVGMDVVDNELKKLGGSMTIESRQNQGTRFRIRLPYTLAITHALIVDVGDETFALPLTTVEGITRVRREDLLELLTHDDPRLEYGELSYRLQHLGSLVGAGASALPQEDGAVALVLVRAGENSAALLTDRLEGSREVVVKGLGPHIASVPGVTGATILGDGRVIMILDAGTLIRMQPGRVAAVQPQPQPPAEDEATETVTALVVDDSITMRRVTERLLERRGAKVVTARDGLDAITAMQESSPDIILLDVEMPRMDGYQFAAHVRNDARFSDVPIIMITSRSSEKHRAKAIELGVNDYLSKPYQEQHLIAAIESQLGRSL